MAWTCHHNMSPKILMNFRARPLNVNTFILLLTDVFSCEQALHGMIHLMLSCCETSLIACWTQVIVATPQAFVSTTSETDFVTTITANTYKIPELNYCRHTILFISVNTAGYTWGKFLTYEQVYNKVKTQHLWLICLSMLHMTYYWYKS